MENSPARVLADWFEGLHFSLTAGQRREGGECFVSAAAPRPAVISSNAEYVNSNGQLSIPIQTYHAPDTQINIHECLLDVLMNLCTCIFSRVVMTFSQELRTLHVGLESEVVWLRRGSWDGDKNNKPIHAAGDTHAAAAV